jgi:hypothetical protein
VIPLIVDIVRRYGKCLKRRISHTEPDDCKKGIGIEVKMIIKKMIMEREEAEMDIISRSMGLVFILFFFFFLNIIVSSRVITRLCIYGV